jgi:hypothetical protein
LTIKNTTPYLLIEGKEVIRLGLTELAILRGFVRDVLNTCRYDDTGVTDDLYDPAMQAADILQIVDVPMLDEDDPDLEEFYRKDKEEDE